MNRIALSPLHKIIAVINIISDCLLLSCQISFIQAEPFHKRLDFLIYFFLSSHFIFNFNGTIQLSLKDSCHYPVSHVRFDRFLYTCHLHKNIPELRCNRIRFFTLSVSMERDIFTWACLICPPLHRHNCFYKIVWVVSAAIWIKDRNITSYFKTKTLIDKFPQNAYESDLYRFVIAESLRIIGSDRFLAEMLTHKYA